MLVNTERLRKKMLDEGLDAMIATSLENVFYVTGFRSVSLSMFPYDGQCYAIVTPDRPAEPTLVSPILESDQILDSFANIQDVHVFGTFYREGPEPGIDLTPDEQRLKGFADLEKSLPGPLEALIAALEKMGLSDKKLGIDELGFRTGFLESLEEKLPGTTIVPAASAFRWIRRIKTEEEIRRIRAAARVVENAILATLAIAREGVTEIELSREFERSVVSQGGIPKFSLVRIGRNAVAGQALPNRTPLRKGDTIWFDVGCVYDGYWSDIARIGALGEPSKRARSLYEAMLEGERQGIAATHPGMTGSELFEITLAATQAAGAPHYRRHHLGHSIGLEVYEQPILAPGNNEIIEEGSVINIETPYYEYGLGALHVEDPFVVRSNGNELLTTLSRKLHIIE